jgi:hypothetical protein
MKINNNGSSLLTAFCVHQSLFFDKNIIFFRFGLSHQFIQLSLDPFPASSKLCPRLRYVLFLENEIFIAKEKLSAMFKGDHLRMIPLATIAYTLMVLRTNRILDNVISK